MGIHNVRWTARYIDGVKDIRGGSTFAGLPESARYIDDFLTHDLVYRVELPAQTIVTLSALNIFDKDPPFTRLDLSYEPFLANPLGRQIKLGASKRF
jgi:iron complex outermembrane receptor protein